MSPEEHTKNREFGSFDMSRSSAGLALPPVYLFVSGSQSRPSVLLKKPLLPEVRPPFRPENVM